MADSKKLSQRDATLVNILERLAEETQHMELRLDEIEKRQSELSAAIGKNQTRLYAKHSETDAGVEKLREEFLRYRSDMLSIVREQDRLAEELKELNKRLMLIIGTQNNIELSMRSINDRAETERKAAHGHYEQAVRQTEALTKDIHGAIHNNEKLYHDTEKLYDKKHRETIKHLEELEHATMRRLLALDGIEAVLQELMIRTEPPEKKPFFVIRIFRRIKLIFRKRESAVAEE